MNFDEIVRNNKQNIKNIIRLITHQDNEDIEQEVYIKLWKNSDKYEERGTLKSWINTIAKNASKDYLKSSAFKNSQNTTSDEVELNKVSDNKISPEDALVISDRQKTIITAVENLKPKFKEVIMLCEIYGYTYEEVSIKLNCPIGTIKSRIFNAKKELASELKNLIE
ncbi:sigma-70 family RNA polymerase sigma factor [bacterium]|nr:sigma-70 family RNA polymerase sigma factor [bacterium]